ncbi:MAG: hypothetical protein ABW110_02695 [Steroidobacteraceae bacterium]
MWSAVNATINAAVEAWLWLFERFTPLVQFCALALPVTLFALLVYRHASDQAGIRAVKNRIQAHLLELRLFKDDLRVTLRAQGQILKGSLRYAGYALAPLAIMLIPMILILIQVESRYAFRPLLPQETTLVEATIDGSAPVSTLDAQLLVPAGLACETPALRLDDEHKILWRVRAERAGEYEVRIRIGGREVRKKIVVGTAGAISPAVYTASDIRTLAYPMERALASDSLVAAVKVSYPRSRGEFAGLSSASWILFLASLVFGYLLRGLFGVTF